MTAVLTSVLVVVALLAVLGVVAFNRLRAADVAAQEALGGIDVALTRRADLVPNLVETVRGYADHERGLLEELTAARAGVRSAAQAAPDEGGVAARAEADAALRQSLVRVDAVAEAYPALRADASFGRLQAQLGETEDRVAQARVGYNEAAGRLNRLVATVPWLFFTGVAGVRRRAFYDAPDAHQAPPQVRF